MKKQFNKINISQPLSEIYPIKIFFPNDKYSYDFSKYGDTPLARLLAKVFYDSNSALTTSSRERTYGNILKFLKILREINIVKPNELDSVHLIKYAAWIDSQSYAPSTKSMGYSTIEKLLNQAKKIKNSGLQNLNVPVNPFRNVHLSRKTPDKLNNDEVKNLLRVCYEKIDEYMSDFRMAQSEISKLELLGIKEENLDFQNKYHLIYYYYKKYKCMPLTTNFSSKEQQLVAKVGMEEILKAISPSVKILLPFYIVLLIELAANSDALRLIECDAIKEDALFEDRCFIQWEKGRSNSIQKRHVLKKKKYGAFNIFNYLLEITQNIRNNIDDKYKNNLFIVRGEVKGELLTLVPRRNFEHATKLFCRDNDLPLFNPSDIRPSVLTEIYKQRKDIVAVSKIANHKNINTTILYVADDVIKEENRAYLSQKQSNIFDNLIENRNREIDITIVDDKFTNAENIGFICKSPIIDKKTCINWMAELTNPNLIIIEDEKYLSNILTLKKSILHAEKMMNKERFEVLYLPILTVINNEIIPKFSKEIISKAEILAVSKELPFLGEY